MQRGSGINALEFVLVACPCLFSLFLLCLILFNYPCAFPLLGVRFEPTHTSLTLLSTAGDAEGQRTFPSILLWQGRAGDQTRGLTGREGPQWEVAAGACGWL